MDGDLTDEVDCSDELSEEKEQEVIYSVSDHSGNRAEAVLKVNLIDLEEPSPTPEPTPVPTVKVPVQTPTMPAYVPPAYEPPAEEYYYDVETVTETHGSDGGETSISWGG